MNGIFSTSAELYTGGIKLQQLYTGSYFQENEQKDKVKMYQIIFSRSSPAEMRNQIISACRAF